MTRFVKQNAKSIFLAESHSGFLLFLLEPVPKIRALNVSNYKKAKYRPAGRNEPRMTEAVRLPLWLVRCYGDSVKAATVGSTSGRGRVKDHFLVLPNQHLSRRVSVCFAFVYTVCTMTVAHVKDPTPTSRQEKAEWPVEWKHR